LYGFGHRKQAPAIKPRLDDFGIKSPVTRITQSRQDIADFIQPLIDRGGVNLDIGVGFSQALNAFGSGNQTAEVDLGHFAAFEDIHSSNGRTPSGQHGIQNKGDGVCCQLFGDFDVIFNALNLSLRNLAEFSSEGLKDELLSV